MGKESIREGADGGSPEPHPTHSRGAQWALHLSFTLVPAHFGLRGICMELYAACVCVHWRKSTYLCMEGSMCVYRCALLHVCAGRRARLGACNLLGHQHVPTCTLVWKSFACENACNVCVQMCVAARDL